jgi:hypothetical protein
MNSCSQFEFDLERDVLEKTDVCKIDQLDGLNDEPFNGLAGINCDDQFLCSVITIFRSFEGIWKEFDDHPLCSRAKTKTGLRCLFCQVRSLSLRLNRAKIKVNLKPVEILSQLDQLPNKEDINFPNYFYQVLKKIELYEEKVIEASLGKSLICQNCSHNIQVGNLWSMHARKQDISQLENPSVRTILSKLLDDAAVKHKCTVKRKVSLKTNGLDKFIIMTFESPNKISIPEEISFQERNYSFISQVYEDKDKNLKSSFKYKNDLYSTVDMKPPEKVYSVLEENILLLVYKLNLVNEDIWQVDDSPIIYKNSSLDNMNHRLNSFLSPEKYEKRKCDQQKADRKRDQLPKRKAEHKETDIKRNKMPKRIEIDKKRDQTPKRKEGHAIIDKKRDQTPNRKEGHVIIDKKRDQTPKRKEEHAIVDKKRDQTPKRKEEHGIIDKKRNQTPKRKEGLGIIDKKRDKTPKRKEEHGIIDKKRNQTPKRKDELKVIETKRRKTQKRKVYQKDYQMKIFVKSIYTDTGFNIVCTCCVEFKSRSLCVKVTLLTENQQNQYLKSFIKSKDGKIYICKICRSQIASEKKPRKSGKSRYQNFPVFFKDHLKTIVNYMTILNRRKSSNANISEAEIDETLQLNKLEAHLLKLTIPFVRIAHCPRGRYVKVKGSMILISSNVAHSMSKILPRKQNLLPVCLKRKLEYTGNYLEEVIDRKKVEAYFNFFKRFNPLFNGAQFQHDQIDKYENECDSFTKIFEEALEKITIQTKEEDRKETE